MKKKIFAANWKMYKTPQETRSYFQKFLEKGISQSVIFFPPALCFEAALDCVKSHASVQVGLQNCAAKSEGAFTGESSAFAAQKMGGQMVLLGHSERRTLFHETDEMVAEKLKFVQSLGLGVMLCIGETLEQRQKGLTESVLKQQLTEGLRHAKGEKLLIAYEPVWAIGTGVNATPDQAEETHKSLQVVLKELGFPNLPLLYGGSVKPENAQALIEKPNIHGFLVGGASLDPDSFQKICSV